MGNPPARCDSHRLLQALLHRLLGLQVIEALVAIEQQHGRVAEARPGQSPAVDS